jgi:hypothetical protein
MSVACHQQIRSAAFRAMGKAAAIGSEKVRFGLSVPFDAGQRCDLEFFACYEAKHPHSSVEQEKEVILNGLLDSEPRVRIHALDAIVGVGRRRRCIVTEQFDGRSLPDLSCVCILTLTT